MKTKHVVISSLLLAIVVGAYCFGYFTRYNALTAVWDVSLGQLTLVHYGLPRVPPKQESKIAAQLGLQTVYIGGCMLTLDQVLGARSYNFVTTQYLDLKLGSNWRITLDQRADSLFRQDQVPAMEAALLANPYWQSIDHYADSATHGAKRVHARILQEKNGANALVGLGDSTGDRLGPVYYYYIDPYTLQYDQIMY